MYSTLAKEGKHGNENRTWTYPLKRWTYMAAFKTTSDKKFLGPALCSVVTLQPVASSSRDDDSDGLSHAPAWQSSVARVSSLTLQVAGTEKVVVGLADK